MWSFGCVPGLVQFHDVSGCRRLYCAPAGIRDWLGLLEFADNPNLDFPLPFELPVPQSQRRFAAVPLCVGRCRRTSLRSAFDAKPTASRGSLWLQPDSEFCDLA